MSNPQLFYTKVGLGKEANWGDPEASTTRDIWLPIQDPRFNPTAYRHIVDSGVRGQPSLEFDLIPGPGEGTGQWGGNVYLDAVPALFNAMIGQDVKSGVGAPYTHTFSPAGVPPSYALEWYTNVNPYVVTGWNPTQLTLNYNGTDGLLTYTVQGLGKLGTTCVASSSTFPTSQSVAGWQGSITVVGGAAATTLMEGSLTFARSSRPIHPVSNTQDISAHRLGPIQLTGRMTFEFTDVEEYNYFKAATKNAVVLNFTHAAGAETLTITMTTMGWRLAEFQASDNIYTVVAQFSGLHNLTDGGVGTVVVTNSRSTAY